MNQSVPSVVYYSCVKMSEVNNNNNDYLITVAVVKGWDILSQSFLKNDVLEAGEMDKRKDLRDSDKGQAVVSRRPGQSIANTAGLVGCSQYAVVSTCQKCSKEGRPMNRSQGHGPPRLIGGQGSSIHLGSKDKTRLF